MEKNKIYLVLAVVLILFSIVVFSIVVFSIYHSQKPLQTITIETSLTISNISGFDLNDTVLKFGEISFGESIRRSIDIENHYDFPIFIYIESKGNISDFLRYPSRVVIEEGKTKNIEIIAEVPKKGYKIQDFFSGTIEARMFKN